MSLWPDDTDEPKELCFCPHCGEQKPEAEEGATDWTTPDYQRDDEGYLICEECWCEEDVERRFEPIYVVPLDSSKWEAFAPVLDAEIAHLRDVNPNPEQIARRLEEAMKSIGSGKSAKLGA